MKPVILEAYDIVADRLSWSAAKSRHKVMTPKQRSQRKKKNKKAKQSRRKNRN